MAELVWFWARSEGRNITELRLFPSRALLYTALETEEAQGKIGHEVSSMSKSRIKALVDKARDDARDEMLFTSGLKVTDSILFNAWERLQLENRGG